MKQVNYTVSTGRMNHLAQHSLNLETERLRLRPFSDRDLDVAVPFYNELEFLNAFEGDPPELPVTREYLWDVAKIMARQGYLFAIVEKESERAIGEACLQWMNLDRGKVDDKKVMRLPIGIWDKALWGMGYGKEIALCLMHYAFDVLEIDWFCAMDVRVENERSKGLWQACGLRVVRELEGGEILDYGIEKEVFLG